MRDQLGLDDPLLVQYGRFLGDMATLDFGKLAHRRPSAHRRRDGRTVPRHPRARHPCRRRRPRGGDCRGRLRRLPAQTGTADYVLRLYGVVIYSFPIFWLGLVLQLVFGLRLGWLPIAGRIDAVTAIGLWTGRRTSSSSTRCSPRTGRRSGRASSISSSPSPPSGSSSPESSSASPGINVIETLQLDFIAASRARGIRERVVVYRHALGNALIPVITLIGLQVAILLAGAVLTETVFSWPGMGLYLVQRIASRDYTAVQSVITVFALFVALISLAVDIVYSLVDPRVRY